MKYTLDKSDWLRIGRDAGWIKGAQGKEEEFWETLAKEVETALNQEHVKSVAKQLAEKMVKNNITDIDKMDRMDKEIEIFANAILGMAGFSKDNAYSICRNEAEAESYFGDALFSTKEDVKYEIYKHIRILINISKY